MGKFLSVMDVTNFVKLGFLGVMFLMSLCFASNQNFLFHRSTVLMFCAKEFSTT